MTPRHFSPANFPSDGVKTAGRAKTPDGIALLERIALKTAAVRTSSIQGAPATRKGVAVPLPSLMLAASNRPSMGNNNADSKEVMAGEVGTKETFHSGQHIERLQWRQGITLNNASFLKNAPAPSSHSLLLPPNRSTQK